MNKDRKVIGHVPEALAKKLFPLMKEWKIYDIKAKIPAKNDVHLKGHGF